eukprot:gene16994-19433_t
MENIHVNLILTNKDLSPSSISLTQCQSEENAERDEESLQESHYNLSGNSISWGTSQDDQIKYEFDKIFPPDSSKKDIYHVVGCPIVPKLMDGINCTVVSFGNTHSGKRKTIYGDSTGKDEPFWSHDSYGNICLSPKLGLLARIAKDLWSQIQQSVARTEVFVSFCNIHAGVHDLLDNYEGRKVRNLKEQMVEVQDLTRTRVSSFEEMMDVVGRGDKVLRNYGFKYNIGDSIYLTSNIIFTVYLKQNLYSNDGEIFVKDSRLELVSVQGNEENPPRRGPQLEVKSLMKVIEALTEPTKFVPYRNSSLTRILSNSLNNNCSMYMLFHLSTHQNCIEQGKTILELANRAKTI